MADKSALVFLRQNNDIDHIVPILYKWSKLSSVSIHIVITTSDEFLGDYRINFLRQFDNIQVTHIKEFLPERFRFSNFLDRMCLHWSVISNKLVNFLKSVRIGQLRPYAKSLSYPDDMYASNECVENLFEHIFEKNGKGIVIFDWIIPVSFVNIVLEESKKRGFPTISLPHGDSPHYNDMVNIDDLNYDRMDNYRRNGEVFDYVVAPNKLCAKRYNKYMGPDRLKVLGSPRYNDEWLDIIWGLIPEYKTMVSHEKLKIVFFFRPKDFSIHWEEVFRTIKMILQFHEVHLIVMHHTRRSSVRNLIKTYPEIGKSTNPNLEFVFHDVYATSLIKWADIILDLGTSATFEAVKAGKPVLAMEYMQANYLTISHYMKNCEIKCRDQLYDIIQHAINNTNFKFYDDEERCKFIKEVIGLPGENVLNGYVGFLEGCFDE